ncbi:dirigent protein 25-like [Nicotiana sylvestris]|uniref:Dirigent protein n=2 Tax=Nicotiana TaxID=4085 RepID=A0A1S3YKH1_TOBAC|nr:PREDICTED: dirigent protein 25-like [Nicotiana sylvestris]XP_016452739.1 PREDICTED: dirigent protein 25-like [Nicotiana tabacum]
MEMLKSPSKLAIFWFFFFFLALTNRSFSARTLNNNPSLEDLHRNRAHHEISFYMLDVLSQKHRSSKPASTKVNSHQLPFSKPLGYFPPVGGIPLTDTNPTVEMNGLHTRALDLEGISMTFPAIATLQELELGTVTTIDENIYEGSIYGSSLMGKAQGMYVASSEDGSSHMMAMTTSFLSNEYKDSLRFFGVHKGDVFESHIAVIGGTGKYHDANGYATVKIVNATSNKSEGAYKILSFSVYLG